MDDERLLREYIASHSEAAFRALVERHVALVYFAALRRLGNPSLAEDVTQVVFIILARKARRLSKKTVLPGWLYRTTRFAAEKALRAESRRHWREREAVEMQTTDDNSVWAQLAPVLDEAMAQLGEMDRTVVLLRFFQNQSLKEVGSLLGISEDAAQKRVSRAITKLRELLRNQGVSVPAAEVAAVISTQAAPAAPVHLVAAMTQAGLGQITVSITVHWLVRQLLHRSFWLKIAAVSGSALLIVTVTILFLYYWEQETARSQLTQGTSRTASVVDRAPSPLAPRAPEIANIRFNLHGTRGLKFNLAFALNAQTQQVTGVLPAKVSFQADAFAASLKVYGPGKFGFEVYRDTRLMAIGAPATFTNAVCKYFIRSTTGGRSLFINVPGRPRSPVPRR